jgi:hypothetical protein
MRFFDTEPQPLYISEIRAALHEIDPAFEIDDGSDALGSGYLVYADALHAEISIDGPGSDDFERERDSILVEIMRSHGARRAEVEHVLRTAHRQICLRVRWGDRSPETTLSRLDVLWDWLFAHRSGLLHAEGEGFYDGEELILAVK